MTDKYVTGVFSDLRGDREFDSRLVIFEADSGARLREAKFTEELSKEEALLGGIGETNVLGLHTACRNTVALRPGV
jgi:hypothetical protein